MPYVSCSKCHHEWETVDLDEKCRWCGSPIGKVLEKDTPLEKSISHFTKKIRQGRNPFDNNN
jgi:Zn finger protein HypA/HybF involved in hydrogenase expression